MGSMFAGGRGGGRRNPGSQDPNILQVWVELWHSTSSEMTSFVTWISYFAFNWQTFSWSFCYSSAMLRLVSPFFSLKQVCSLKFGNYRHYLMHFVLHLNNFSIIYGCWLCWLFHGYMNICPHICTIRLLLKSCDLLGFILGNLVQRIIFSSYSFNNSVLFYNHLVTCKTRIDCTWRP